MSFSNQTLLPFSVTFFTARLANRDSMLLTDEISALRAATRRTMLRYPFTIDAIAVLPSAIHTIWHLPPGDSNFALRWRMLKTHFSKAIPDTLSRTPAQSRARAKGIWQTSIWEHPIKCARDFDTHVQMIHTSPVIAGLCKTPQDWAYSSVHRQSVIRPFVPETPRISRPAPNPIIARTFHHEGFAPHP
ncbi:REP-associated tyrosine transposase [Sulfitobacter aestuariivivens]|uniref:Transposase n=1 Tax=Sulfitobacter aestuariivivens TaxID=2766981 RepID=A0A927D1Y8_9RHOB|nr:transposase [Sulfitobacter aestuariivivens]MBD3663615.1 transposase [Sulfitobacter aestuariivivens]